MSQERELKEYLEDKIDRFIKNSRNLGELISRITARSIETTNICEIDEANCVNMEINEKGNFIMKELMVYGVSQAEAQKLTTSIMKNGARATRSAEIGVGNMVDIEIKAQQSAKKIRIREAHNLLDSYRRISFNLDEGGYRWDKFFRRESDEPENEKLYRESITEGLRKDLRHKAIKLFLNHTYVYLDAMLRKDINFLINNLKHLFNNDEFTTRISLIFGSENADGVRTTQYASEAEINTVWRIIHGCVKNSILYCKAAGITEFTVHQRNQGKMAKRNVLIDYEDLRQKWEVEYI